VHLSAAADRRAATFQGGGGDEAYRRRTTFGSGVPGRARRGLLGWLRANPNLSVTAPRKGSIGSDLPATVVDVGVAPQADNDDPDCPAKRCANFLSFPQFTETYGLAGHAVTRFYLSDVRYGGRTHLFVAAVEAPDRSRLHSGLPAAERVIKSVDVPVAPA